MRHSIKYRGSASFTLIELLVVVAIIAILIAILLPSLASARERARTVDCKSNGRQLFLVAQMYTNSWNDSYPPAWNLSITPSIAWCGEYKKVGTVTYMDVTKSPLWPYLQEKKTLFCPTFTGFTAKYSGSGAISGYGINSQYVAGNPDKDPNGMNGYMLPARTGQIAAPDRTIIFADCALFDTTAKTAKEEIFVYPLYRSNGVQNKASFHFRHGQTANMIFCDGHVENCNAYKTDTVGSGLFGWMPNNLMDRE
jgi:prepilin-type processing-associated H-X9-DG protein/prepilin-type N-terminal cleavage/methylation domain-containing protein